MPPSRDRSYAGSFDELRRRLDDRRRRLLETDSPAATAPPGAVHVSSEGRRHEYAFDAMSTAIGQLLAAAAARAYVVDVETHRAPIEDVVADLYRDRRGS